MAKPRKFSPEFKAKIALAALRGEATAAELYRKHQLSDTVISRWKRQLVKSAHQVFASTTAGGKESHASRELAGNRPHPAPQRRPAASRCKKGPARRVR